MQNPENTIVVTGDEVPAHTTLTEEGAVTVTGIQLPAPEKAKEPRNQHLKVNEPKNKQLGGRATQSEYDLLEQVMKANGCADIVRLALYSINLHRKDFLTPFKFK